MNTATGKRKTFCDISDLKLMYSNSTWFVNSHTSDAVEMVCSYAHYHSFVQLGTLSIVLCSHD